MSIAAPSPAYDHCVTTTLVACRIGALISAVATIEPPKKSWGISSSGMKLVAWSWLRTTAEIEAGPC